MPATFLQVGLRRLCSGTASKECGPDPGRHQGGSEVLTVTVGGRGKTGCGERGIDRWAEGRTGPTAANWMEELLHRSVVTLVALRWASVERV